MLIHKGIVGKIYPNQHQKEWLKQEFGDVRFVWNFYLDKLQKRYKNKLIFIKGYENKFGKKPKNKDIPKNYKFPSKYKLQKTINELKKKDPWLKIASAESLNMEIYNLCDTYKRFFKGLCGRPRFKSRKFHRKSYMQESLPKQSKTTDHNIKLPKLGFVRIRLSQQRIPIVKKYTKQSVVTLTPSGNYKISFSVVYDNKKLFPKTGRKIGIDVGLDHLLNLSNGMKWNFKYYAKANSGRKHYWQKRLARRRRLAVKNIRQGEHYKKKIASYRVKPLSEYKNYQKAKRIVARINQHIADQRDYYLHYCTTWLVKHYDVIVIEDLKVQNMQHNHHLARAIANASWRKFRILLNYKCQWYGKKLITVNPRNTSRICHTCGKNTGPKPLNIRKFKCPYCGTLQDRDVNAAINILHLGLYKSMKPRSLKTK